MSSDLYAICFAFKRRFVKVRNYFLFCLTALQLKILFTDFYFSPNSSVSFKKGDSLNRIKIVNNTALIVAQSVFTLALTDVLGSV